MDGWNGVVGDVQGGFIRGHSEMSQWTYLGSFCDELLLTIDWCYLFGCSSSKPPSHLQYRKSILLPSIFRSLCIVWRGYLLVPTSICNILFCTAVDVCTASTNYILSYCMLIGILSFRVQGFGYGCKPQLQECYWKLLLLLSAPPLHRRMVEESQQPFLPTPDDGIPHLTGSGPASWLVAPFIQPAGAQLHRSRPLIRDL